MPSDGTLSRRILDTSSANPDLSSFDVALLLGTSPNYVREVWFRHGLRHRSRCRNRPLSITTAPQPSPACRTRLDWSPELLADLDWCVREGAAVKFTKRRLGVSVDALATGLMILLRQYQEVR